MSLCKSLVFLVLFLAHLPLSYAQELDNQHYKLIVESIEEFEDDDGDVEIVCRLSNGTEWLVQQPMIYRLKPLESVPIGAQFSIFSNTEPEVYGVLINQTLDTHYSRQTSYAGTLLAGKEHLPTITSIERANKTVVIKNRLPRDRKITLWTLSDGSVWASTEPLESYFNDYEFCEDAWQVDDHALISTEQFQDSSEECKRWWMLNTDYDWCSSSYGEHTYKPFLWIYPVKNPSDKVLQADYKEPPRDTRDFLGRRQL